MRWLIEPNKKYFKLKLRVFIGKNRWIVYEISEDRSWEDRLPRHDRRSFKHLEGIADDGNPHPSHPIFTRRDDTQQVPYFAQSSECFSAVNRSYIA
jgi:hypothetical protein